MSRLRVTAAAIAFSTVTVISAAVVAAGDAQQLRDDRDVALHRDFLQTGDTHFTMLFEGPEDAGLASRALTVLEGAYFHIGATLAHTPMT